MFSQRGDVRGALLRNTPAQTYSLGKNMQSPVKASLSLFFVGLMLLLAACSTPAPSPAPSPQEQPKAAVPPPEEPRPAVEERQIPVEQPQQQAAAARKPAAPVKQATKRTVPPAPEPQRPAPVETTASTAPGTLTLPAPVAPPVEAPAPPADEVKPIRIEPPPPREVKVPSGTLIAVRMIDSVDSETAHVGETFKASLDAPIVVDNDTVFPKGSEIFVKLSRVESAGRVSGKSELQLQLDRIFLGKKSYMLESNTYVNSGTGQGGRTARSAGIGAAIGAAIGAISGGGKGAVIGGATGAGAGAGVEAIRKGEQVRVDSETRLDFRLEAPLEVTLESPSPTPPQRNNSGPLRFGTRP
jgi:hypothetical protein